MGGSPRVAAGGRDAPTGRDPPALTEPSHSDPVPAEDQGVRTVDVRGAQRIKGSAVIRAPLYLTVISLPHLVLMARSLSAPKMTALYPSAFQNNCFRKWIQNQESFRYWRKGQWQYIEDTFGYFVIYCQ